MVKLLTYAFTNPPDSNDMMTTVSVKVRLMCSYRPVTLSFFASIPSEHQCEGSGSVRNLAGNPSPSVVAWTFSAGSRVAFTEMNF